MQKVLSFLLLSFISTLSFSQNDHKQVINSDIKDVTVFITGGEVTRDIKVNLKTGRNILVYSGISSVVDSKSIQFRSTEKLDIVSVSTELDYLKFR